MVYKSWIAVYTRVYVDFLYSESPKLSGVNFKRPSEKWSVYGTTGQRKCIIMKLFKTITYV